MQHIKLNILVLFLGTLTLLVGCASGGTFTDPFALSKGATFDYRYKAAFLDFESEANVAVGVVDQRPRIMNGEKQPNYVGIVRDGFGAPSDVLTHSNEPLVNDLTTSISLTLENSGMEPSYFNVPSITNVDQAKNDLMRLEANRYLLVIVNQWQSNTYSRTELKYGLELIIFSSDGAEIIRKTFSGAEVGSYAAFSPVERNAYVLAEIYPAKLKEIFEDEAILSALTLAANEEPVTSSN